MKLAMLAPIAWRTPPEHYGPWESIASLLTEGLVARGVDVTLFATLDSVTAAALDGVCPHGYAEDAQLDGRVWEALHVSHALARSGEFELVHNHLDWLPLEHRRSAVVVATEPVPGEVDANQPGRLARDPERAPAGVGEGGHLDGLLVETGAGVAAAAAAHRGHRQVAIASLGAQQELQKVQATVEG